MGLGGKQLGLGLFFLLILCPHLLETNELRIGSIFNKEDQFQLEMVQVHFPNFLCPVCQSGTQLELFWLFALHRPPWIWSMITSIGTAVASDWC